MTRTDFIDIMTGIMEMYAGRFNDIGDLAMEIWYEALSDLDYATTKKAVINHVKSSKFPPTVADIREQYGLIAERNKTILSEIEKLFEETRNYYPNGNHDLSAENTYFALIVEKEPVERLDYAKTLRDKTIQYVKRCERANQDTSISLSEFLKRSGEQS